MRHFRRENAHLPANAVERRAIGPNRRSLERSNIYPPGLRSAKHPIHYTDFWSLRRRASATEIMLDFYQRAAPSVRSLWGETTPHLEQLVAHAADSVVLRHGEVRQQVAVPDVRRDGVTVLVCCPFAATREFRVAT